MDLELPPVSPTTPSTSHTRNPPHDDADSDADTASQRSISLDSPTASRRQSAATSDSDAHRFLANPGAFLRANDIDKRESNQFTVDTDFSSDADDMSLYKHRLSVTGETPNTSAAPSIFEEEPLTATKENMSIPPMPPLPSTSMPTLAPVPATVPVTTTYPPTIPNRDDTISISSLTSTTSSRKARPESLLVTSPKGPLVLGIALVDFNHLVGPRIEWSKGEIFDDEEVAKILPFLALPDGAHLVGPLLLIICTFSPIPNRTPKTTRISTSCNQQISAKSLLVKDPDVTRSTVQKAVVVLASKPVFGPIRDKLRVVTTALFQQRDFSDTSILDAFSTTLEPSLRGQLTESGLYMGTREFVHAFRHRTLILVKALILQKKIMFFGHPVERLCTYQYSLISLLPGLLQTLEDCGSPPLANRAPTLSRPNSLKTSDHKSMMAFMGLPLDVFGKDAFFQPYLPLQQLDMIKDTPSWLCGSTNSIVTQQKEVDLLVNTETGTIEFRDPRLERSAGLTAADRKWMDDIVNDVNEHWDDANPSKTSTFKVFEEYISAALSSVKYRDFVLKGEGGGVLITGGTGGDASNTDDFNPLWISEFRHTNAYAVWNRITDPLIFDIIEPRHPCTEKPGVVADLGLRLHEGIQELKIEQQLAPAREAVARTFATGSTSFFKAVEGVRERWTQRQTTATSTTSSSSSIVSDTSGLSTPVEVSKAELLESPKSASSRPFSLFTSPSASPSMVEHARSPSAATTSAASAPAANLSTWGAGIGSFFSSKLARARSSEGPSEGQVLPQTQPAVAPAPVEKVLPPVVNADVVLSPQESRSSLPPLPLTTVDVVPASPTVTTSPTTSTLRPMRLGTAGGRKDVTPASSVPGPARSSLEKGKDEGGGDDEHVYAGVAL
ncbi:hypothetical protein P691DRAFT_800360 [Macrolepiota fuliginosa MF-IS2]|uniref:UDENN domain-containing protein n=1 Tax=Macrolepiota fuliginosa MF-IS2 TaxID=1400762 RepID=A0A9P5XGC1_9AGAR|nr:hypothetical protein P691DRAFT_800360 [Macrolepiota fuliginosa MF-IS2]